MHISSWGLGLVPVPGRWTIPTGPAHKCVYWANYAGMLVCILRLLGMSTGVCTVFGTSTLAGVLTSTLAGVLCIVCQYTDTDVDAVFCTSTEGCVQHLSSQYSGLCTVPFCRYIGVCTVLHMLVLSLCMHILFQYMVHSLCTVLSVLVHR